MFVGHYGPSFAGKVLRQSVPLWALFLAVQLLDVFWSIFVLLGIEKVRVVPGFMAASPLDLYYMPYTHSLEGAIFWAVAGGIAYWLIRRADGWGGAGLVSVAVFSHWILDFIVHGPDLPLWGSSLKVGLGLWNYPITSFVLEISLLFGGMYLYLKRTEPLTGTGRYGMLVFGGVMAAVQAVAYFGPPPPSGRAAAIAALTSYIVFASTAYWLERKRVPRGIAQAVGGS